MYKQLELHSRNDRSLFHLIYMRSYANKHCDLFYVIVWRCTLHVLHQRNNAYVHVFIHLVVFASSEVMSLRKQKHDISTKWISETMVEVVQVFYVIMIRNLRTPNSIHNTLWTFVYYQTCAWTRLSHWRCFVHHMIL